jgi:succinyl-CoA synthetase beta subunit
MKLYENEAKTVFKVEGIPVPEQYGIVSHINDLKAIREALEFPVMLKSLVLVGGRGRAGGIRKANDFNQARVLVNELLDRTLKGYRVEKLLVEQAVREKEACYVGVTMDPVRFNNVVMVSPWGGVGIEKVAKENPEALISIELPNNDDTLAEESAERFAEFLTQNFREGKPFIGDLKDIMTKVYTIYQKCDCRVVEINPLMITEDGPVAADAKMILDDNGLYRQRRLFDLLGIQASRHDVSEPTQNEVRAQLAGFPYIDLLSEDRPKDPNTLYVGLVPGGAGYGILSIDEVVHIGERYFKGRVVPVNFMDSGGGPSLERVKEMFCLLMDYEIVDLIITSRFGGISSCDTFIRGLVTCFRERHQNSQRIVPVYGRMVGTDLSSARGFLEKAKRETPDELKEMHIVVGNQTIMAEIIREGIQRAFERRGRNS